MEKLSQIWGYYAPAHLVDDADRARGIDSSKPIKSLFKTYTLKDTAHYNRGNNDPYYHNILVGGANAAGKGFMGLSYLPFGVASKGNNSLFRWNESDKIKKEIDNAVRSGKNVRVFGHSWGGATVANLARDYPNIPFYSLDPTSWTQRIEQIPKNLTIARPYENYDQDERILTKLAPILGGRWPKIESQPDRYIEYKGGHVEGVDEVVNKIIFDTMLKRTWNNTMHKIQGTTPIEKTSQHIGVIYGNSKGQWNRFATNGNPADTNQIPSQARTPSFQKSPFKPLYPERPRTNDIGTSRNPTANNEPGNVLSYLPGSLRM